MNTPQRGPGRPPGSSSTRARILKVAAARFLEVGYPRTTMRWIAAQAGVDVSTVAHHAGRKADLFAAAMLVSLAPAQLLDHALRQPRHKVPDAIAHIVCEAWSVPAHRDALQALLSRALIDPQVARASLGYLEHEVLHKLADHIGGRHATSQAATVMSIACGVFVTHHALGLDAGVAKVFKRSIARTLRTAFRR